MTEAHYVLAISIIALLVAVVTLPILVMVLRRVISIDTRLKAIEAQRDEELRAQRFPRRA
jgi:hypothetical protein